MAHNSQHLCETGAGDPHTALASHMQLLVASFAGNHCKVACNTVDSQATVVTCTLDFIHHWRLPCNPRAAVEPYTLVVHMQHCIAALVASCSNLHVALTTSTQHKRHACSTDKPINSTGHLRAGSGVLQAALVTRVLHW